MHGDSVWTPFLLWYPRQDLTMLAFAVLLFASANALPSSRIINGEDAEKHEFAHQVSLQTSSGSHFCGGSVVGTTWVVTAAHCVDWTSPRNIKVIVKEHKFSEDGEQEETYSASKFIIHRSYGSGSGLYANDIALIKLRGQVNADYIIPRATSGDFNDARCIISGWGLTNEGEVADTLQKVDVRVLSHAECNGVFGSNVDEQEHICVFGTQENGAGACNGDSGGPLVCEGKLAGVTSWGVSGCHVNGTVSYPSVYTRVTTHDTWFKTNMI